MGLVEMLRRCGTAMLVSDEVSSVIGAVGLIALALSWHKRGASPVRLSQVGWIGVGLYFFNDTFTYMEHDDLILTLFSALTLPMAIGMAVWEERAEDDKSKASLTWARGAVAYAGGPYLLIAHVPWLSVLAIWFVAGQAAFFLRFSGGDNVVMGETWVNTPEGQISWSEFDGNRWFMGSSSEEYLFQTELLLADGTPIGINFVLACTALQSMVIFVGAIAVLDIDWRRRCRVLFLTIPLIHILNLFRNAGLIWLHTTYVEWTLLGMSVFEFGHSYVARFVSLFAMFIMALIMFDLLPELHRHIVRLLKPLGLLQPKKRSN
jgi:archaeosortase A (PGF-CTERM-specific)